MHAFTSRGAALTLAALLLAIPAGARAQDTTRARPDSSSTPKPEQPRPVPSPSPLNFSGVIFTSFQSGGSRAERNLGQQNRFDVERAYLTFRAPAGDNLSIRVTADVFQQRADTANQYYAGWTFRAKYAYAEYGYVRGRGDRLGAVARLGILHTPIIDWEETFWIRGVTNTAVEREGFFSSADAGAATAVTLPGKLGEVYLGVYNGNGYTSKETDRFKDVGGRVTLTPLMRRAGLFQTLAITPWYYKGWRASTVATIHEGRQKDRYGVHVGIKDPRIVLAGQFAQKVDESTGAAPAIDVTGRVISTYTIVKPLAFLENAPRWPVNLLFRMDQVKPNIDRDFSHRYYVGGLGWDLSRKAQLWVDFQDQEARRGDPATDLKTLFVHAIVNF